MIPYCQGDEAREPEERGDDIDNRICGLGVPFAGVETRGEGEVGQGREDGPDGGEKEEDGLGGGEGVVDDWRIGSLSGWGSLVSWRDREGQEGRINVL